MPEKILVDIGRLRDVEDMYATFFVIALLGAVLSYSLATLRARWLPWVQDVGER